MRRLGERGTPSCYSGCGSAVWVDSGIDVPLLMVKAGLHWSRRMSRQMLPFELMLGW
jgi:hypothetical protein